jgi:hypothetical protein
VIQYEKVVRLNLPAERRVWPWPVDRHDLDTVHYAPLSQRHPLGSDICLARAV